MSRYLILATALLTIGDPATAWADDAKDVKAIATAKDDSRNGRLGPFEIKREGLVVRGAEELVATTGKAKSASDTDVQKEMTAELAKLLKVDAVDWKKHTVVGVIGSIDSMKAEGKILTVTYMPFKEGLTRAIPPTPKVVVLIERFAGEVKFVKAK